MGDKKQLSVYFKWLRSKLSNLGYLNSNLYVETVKIFTDLPKNTKRLPYYFKIWWMMSKNSFMIVLSKKLLFVMFLVGKLMRFTFFILFIYFAVSSADGLAGYSVNQVIFFFLTFNIVDVVSQFLFREVYRFRNLVTSGDFDLVMVKPMNPLFRVLLGGADIIDLVTIPPLIFAVWYLGRALGPTTTEIIAYTLLLVNGILIGAAFHIAVLAFGIITYEVDHVIMIYRDLGSLGRLPVDVYAPILRLVLTYLLPIAIMMTLPAKAIMGLVSPIGIFGAMLLGLIAIWVSTRLWMKALKSYSSASS